jgi:hypothetical protein
MKSKREGMNEEGREGMYEEKGEGCIKSGR